MPDRLEEFGAAILDSARPVPAGLVGPDGNPSSRRFAVYRNNVVVGLIDTLTAAFPVVCRIVGTDFFRAMAAAYAVRHPPRSPIMLDYGCDFPDFISRFTPAATVPYLADVARLERAWAEAYNASEAEPLGHEQLAAIPAEHIGGLIFKLHPTLRLLRSIHPVVTIWQMNLDGGHPEPVDLNLAEDALIIRPFAEVEVRTIASGGAGFIDALWEGKTLEEAAKAALRENPRFDLAGNIAGAIQMGALIGWQPNPQRKFETQRETNAFPE
jgi:hypothetical protein